MFSINTVLRVRPASMHGPSPISYWCESTVSTGSPVVGRLSDLFVFVQGHTGFVTFGNSSHRQLPDAEKQVVESGPEPVGRDGSGFG
jgi:hypothetical protein